VTAAAAVARVAAAVDVWRRGAEDFVEEKRREDYSMGR